MNRSFCKWVTVVAVLAGICGSPTPVRAQDAGKIDLAEITQRLTKWRESFVNLRLVYESRSLETTNDKPLTDWPAPEDPQSARLFNRAEWIWADHGLDLLEDRAFPVKPLGIRNIDVFNGPKGVVFRANYRQNPEGTEELKELYLRGLGAGKPTSMKSRVATDGLYWPGLGAWLPEVLTLPEWQFTFEAIEEVGGERCARFAKINSADVAYRLWFDLNHDCLLRRKLSRIGDIGIDYVVDEFQRLENGIWFPKRGRLQLQSKQYENQLWVITEAAVNQSLDLSRFDPPAPMVGTVVDDGKGNVRAHGVAAAVSQPGASPNVGGGAMPQLSSPRSATPPMSNWLWWSSGLLLTSFVCLVAGFLFWRRK